KIFIQLLMPTLLGKYLKKLKSNRKSISQLSGINYSRIIELCNIETTNPYAEDFFKIIYIANNQAGLDESNFNTAINEIFPNRIKANLLEDFQKLSPEARFFKKYTQKQSDIEKKLGIANGKISKFYGDNTKRALAIEIISFAEGMELDVLTTFKEIYGEVEIKYDEEI